ncbi:hypothetical protein [Brevifollis gellanilyticus]|uniref:Uncharacterized protein n=1 Tax=Brevifollis gellanilyticus TaxID=748831 RepID=A0A512M6D8_9BACT|nr:hypothetical protein [Brevifollis gellanilyticus]GEP42292.1 hypothetical protein BGE01nite_15830 [Brevifollis gellanilyticus]
MNPVLAASIYLLALTLHCAAWAGEPPEPSSETERLVTRIYSIPPDFGAYGAGEGLMDPFVVPEVYPAVPGRSFTLSRHSTKGWPAGAGVVINRQTHRIVIRNIKANMKGIESLIAQWNADWQKRQKTQEPLIYYDEVTFIVTPRKQAGRLLEAVCLLPTNFTTTDLAEELKQQGVPFPKDAAAHWNAATRQATIRSTSANLDLIIPWFASLWEASKETPPYQNKAPSPVLLEQGQVDQAMRDLASQKP